MNFYDQRVEGPHELSSRAFVVTGEHVVTIYHKENEDADYEIYENCVVVRSVKK